MKSWRIVAEILLLAPLLALLGFLLGHTEYAWHATDVMGVGALALAAMGFLTRLRIAASCWLAMGILLLAPYLPLFLPRAAAAPQGCELRVLYFKTKLSWGPREPEVARALAAVEADIVIILETGDFARLREALPENSPLRGYAPVGDPTGVVVGLSRFANLGPVVQENGLSTGRIRIEGREVALTTGRSPRDFDGEPAALRRFTNALHALAAQPGPHIIGVDLNAGPQSIRARQIRHVLRDAHGEAGFGLGHTFPAPGRRLGAVLPFLRIDYLFSDRGLVPVASRVLGEAAGSTHYPVWARYVFAGVGRPGYPCQG